VERRSAFVSADLQGSDFKRWSVRSQPIVDSSVVNLVSLPSLRLSIESAQSTGPDSKRMKMHSALIQVAQFFSAVSVLKKQFHEKAVVDARQSRFRNGSVMVISDAEKLPCRADP
jgi:hypothetical protein